MSHIFKKGFKSSHIEICNNLNQLHKNFNLIAVCGTESLRIFANLDV